MFTKAFDRLMTAASLSFRQSAQKLGSLPQMYIPEGCSSKQPGADEGGALQTGKALEVEHCLRFF